MSTDVARDDDTNRDRSIAPARVSTTTAPERMNETTTDGPTTDDEDAMCARAIY